MLQYVAFVQLLRSLCINIYLRDDETAQLLCDFYATHNVQIQRIVCVFPYSASGSTRVNSEVTQRCISAYILVMKSRAPNAQHIIVLLR
jgi:hypothetical protein